MDRFQFGHGWERTRLFTNVEKVRSGLWQRIVAELGAGVEVQWRRVGTQTWLRSRTPAAAAADILTRAKALKGAVRIEVRYTAEPGGRLVLHKYVADPPSPGAIPAAALATTGTKRTLRFHSEIHLAVPAARPLGLYNPRPIKSDIPKGWETGDPWPSGAYASEHAHACADDCGVDNLAGTAFSTDPARLDAMLDDVTAYTLANFIRLGVVEHIYEGSKWIPGPNGSPVKTRYGGSDAHETHTHTAFADHDGAKPAWL